MHREFLKLFLASLLLAADFSQAAEPAHPSRAPTVNAPGGDVERFATPDAAAKTLVEAVRGNDRGQLVKVLGGSHPELISSGDEVADANNRESFVQLAGEKIHWEQVGEDKAILHLGKADWPFPVPLMKSAEGWAFDAEQGYQEVLDRRIGRNELSTLNVLDAYVEAQFEYANIDRDGDGVAEYAQKLRSDSGTHDGLFWETHPGEPDSPMGPLVAEARAEGYLKGEAGKSSPYHGYYFKILKRQGSHAPGGKYDYVINGNMIAGFAAIAFPAEYGSSGIMTFIVNHQGKIHQKDLGPKTAQIAAGIQEYDPDPTWKPEE